MGMGVLERGHRSMEQTRKGGAEKWEDLRSTALSRTLFCDSGERVGAERLPPAHMRFPVVQAVLGALLLRKGVVWWLVMRSLVTRCLALRLQERKYRLSGHSRDSLEEQI